jgi:hypothetical protein
MYAVLRKVFSSAKWKLLRSYIDPKIFVDKETEFLAFLTRERTFTLCLCFQHDYYDFLESARPENVSSVKLENIAFSILLLLAEEQLNKGIQDYAVMWTTFLKMRRTVSFPNVGLCEAKIFLVFLRRIDFDSFEAIEALSEFIAVENVDYANKDAIRNDMEAALLRFMNSDKITLRNFSHFLVLPLSKCIRQPALFDVMDHVLGKLIDTRDSFEEKLLLIDSVYKKMVGENWGSQDACESRVISYTKNLQRSVSCAGVFPALCECLRVASTKLDLFSLPVENNRMVKTITRRLARDCVEEIIQKPVILRAIPSAPEGKSFLFFDVLVSSLQDAVRCQYKSVAEAALLYIDVRQSSIVSDMLLGHKIAMEAFESALQSWKPKNMLDISPTEKITIDVLFNKSTVDCTGFSTTEHREFIKELVVAWTLLYDSDKLTPVDLRLAKVMIESRIWDNFEAFTNAKLPTVTSIQNKLDEISGLRDTMKQYMTVPVNDRSFPLLDVLREYHCDLQVLLMNLFQAYATDPFECSLKTLFDMKEDYATVSGLVEPNRRIFYLCGYFLLYPSLLFRDAVFPKNDYSHSIATLTTSVNDACKRIQEIFGSDIHYGGVSGAMEVLSSINLINSEICAFMNCDDLHISIADVNNFRLVAFLWRLSATLPSFIQGCEHFGFTIAEDDSSFSELRFEVNQFYSSDFNCLDTCLNFLTMSTQPTLSSIGDTTCQQV